MMLCQDVYSVELFLYRCDPLTCTFPADHPRRKESRADPAVTQGDVIFLQ